MLDHLTRHLIAKPLYFLAYTISKHTKITPNQTTIFGFFLGLLSIYNTSIGNFQISLIFIIFNRIFDGLDGALARVQKKNSDFGGFIDILCDFVVYGGSVFGFAVFDREKFAFPAAFLLFSYVGPVSSFLLYAILETKNKAIKRTKDINQTINTKQGVKSFYYLSGICEGTETIIVMVMMLLWPDYMPKIAYFYGVLCWLTTVGRTYRCYVDFG